MQRFYSILFLVLMSALQAQESQPNTEIFLFDLLVDNGNYTFSNGKNISNNEGYDNQPSFVNDNQILFASTRNDQTDIISYRANYDVKTWVNFTEGGEYTPLKIPNKNAISAVRLDKDGKQRLYSYNLSNGNSTELINDLVVAYYRWYNDETIVSAVIENDSLNLYVSNIKDQTNRRYQKNVGRSFHKIPNTNLVSYISKANAQWTINSLNPATGETKVLANTLDKVEDICWLINGDIISGKGSKLYKLTLNKDTNWKEIADLSKDGISKITRITSNEISNKFLVAGDISAASTNNSNNTSETTNSGNSSQTQTQTDLDAGAIVQKHIDPYNKGDLDGFANAFSPNVVVSNFPNKKSFEGLNQLKQRYQRFFQENKNLSVVVNKRIVLNNFVIDDELVTVNTNTNRQATIYTTSEKGIETMTFIANQASNTNPELIVNKQLNAYNTKNIDAFMATYTQDIKLYDYPDTLSSSGQDTMRNSYADWFKRANGLNAKVIDRIIIGNKVIDKEIVTFNNQTIYAIAIYEVDNGLIKSVTFLR